MTALQTIAAEAQPSLFLIVAGVVLVVLLVSAFWYGSRRRRRATAPPRPTEQNPLMQRPEDSWQTPQEHAREEEKHRYPHP
ncbi:DUF6479 family protein [Streptomyces sp. NRRL S-237]|uniref:DUF6479 family protein n=1 Tax=Streptomyces sp. NRRL S-237 TaxID=1463895 RepID=UPI0004C787B2|nr:DUF6479 family protein [Streptomyces sp. NRRL S-237]